MARSSVAVEVGSSAVRLAGVSRSRSGAVLQQLGQAPINPGVVVDGDVVDIAALSEAVRHLVKANKPASKDVHLGLVSQRMVARQVDLPWVPAKEFKQALPLLAADCLPMPVQDCVLDFLAYEEVVEEDGARMIRGLLVAAGEEGIQETVDAVESGGLRVASVTLTPLATLGAVADPLAASPEALLDVGYAMTSVTIQEHGQPRFVRILSRGGHDITVSLAEQLGISEQNAEQWKCGLPAMWSTMSATDRAATETAIRSAVTDSGDGDPDLHRLLQDQRGDAHRSGVPRGWRGCHARAPAHPGVGPASPGDSWRRAPGPARQVAITRGARTVRHPRRHRRGGPCLGGGMTTSYSGPPPTGNEEDPRPGGQEPQVQVAAPRDSLDALLRRDDFPVPDLIPPSILVRRAVRKAKRMVAIAMIGVLSLLALLFVVGRVQLASANAELATAQQRLRNAEAEKAKYSEVPAVYAAVDAARAELTQAMGNEVQVARLVSQLAAILPPDVALTQVSMTIGEPDKSGTGTAASTTQTTEPLVGTVTFSGEARSFNDVSAWIDTLRNDPDYENVILTDVSRDTTADVYVFTNTAELTDQALSGRFVEGDQ